MFKGHIDMRRVGLAGHSAGGNGVAGMGDIAGVKVIVPISASAATTGTNVLSSLFIGGTADGVVQFSASADSYTKSEVRSHKRLVGISGAAHTGVTSLCEIKNPKGKSIVEVAKESGVLSGALGLFAGNLFDCNKNTTPQADVVPIINAASVAVFEEALHCDTTAGAALDAIKTQFSKVERYENAP
jgi:hypothetical protein